MESEFQALLRNATWTLCSLPPGKNVVPNIWVFKCKRRPDGSIERLKTQLVVVGYLQRSGLDFHEIFSPVIKPSTVLYVDDILVTSNDRSFVSSLISKLQLDFAMNDLVHLSYFLGIEATRDSSGLHLRQTKHNIDLLERVKLLGIRPYRAPCVSGSKLSKFDGEALSDPSEYRHTAGDPDNRRSTCAYGIYVGPNLISWSAKKQPIVSKSSTEAEYMCLALVTARVYWLRMLLCELQASLDSPPVIWCDNISALALASNPIFHA
ncbi:hypothetical protein F2P56_021615 [Juglans regia]|uniref:Reverse transcriptase Ty1/copia-type domain-containing protein n=1 Tax=Juglans regia TaxID=51240 RepID=A0A833U662_JUGRE|nr:hypothetical protein F2P56_021615 [Juglans regia]